MAHGFIRTADGVITTFDIVTRTGPSSINPGGTIVGSSFDWTTVHGFLRDHQGATTSFDAVPGAYQTVPQSINPAGVVTGYYLAPSPLGYVGFVRNP